MSFRRNPAEEARYRAVVADLARRPRTHGELLEIAALHGLHPSSVSRIRTQLDGKARARSSVLPTEEIRQLCFCAGCLEPPRPGTDFCERHSADTMCARASYHLSEPMRRKLVGGRA